jgi:hypothetical protein
VKGLAAAHAGRMILTLIASAEVLFWVVLAAGLAVRYLLRRPRLGVAVLLGVPLIDLLLLIATTIDLRDGGEADFAHGLAFAYLGFTVAFGHSVIRWADQRFAHRFAGGPEPWKPPKEGWANVRYEWREFGKAVLAWAISCGLLLAAILLIGDADRTEALEGWIARLSMVVGIWSLWPITATLWPRGIR